MLGQFSNTYGYDNFNRLTTASGYFTGSKTAPPVKKADYTLQMEYSSTGEINKKTQVHNKNGFGVSQNSYTHTYTHEPNTHRLEKVTKPDNSKEQFEYDNNGNVVLVAVNNNETKLTWDEANRLKQVEMPASVQSYWYDAAGERVLKGNGRKSDIFVKGEKEYSELRYDNFTIYPNGYITISSENSYTKHYYMGSQRLASRPVSGGSGGWKEVSSAELTTLKQRQQDDLKAMLAHYDFNEIHYSTASEVEEDSVKTTTLFYFHPDHLGTSTLLTDNLGNPYQFFLNLPFGETMAEQKATGTFTNPYLFNGKELDEETGMYYYGARYYNPRYSVWLGVDPMVEKYAGYSPYCFTGGNPISNIDIDGYYWIKYHNLTFNKKHEYSVYSTNYRWANSADNWSNIPFIGTVFEISLAFAKEQDPSFNMSKIDYVTLGLSLIGAGSAKLIKRLNKVDNLGKGLLIFNRDVILSLPDILSNPQLAEVKIDEIALKRLESKGYGKYFVDDSGKTIENEFRFNGLFIGYFQNIVLKDKSLTSKDNFNLQEEVMKKMSLIIDSEKEAIRMEIQKSIQTLNDE